MNELDTYLTNRLSQKLSSVNRDESFLAQWHKWLDSLPVLGAATLLNTYITHKRPAAFSEPESITIEIYDSFAGKIPLVIFGNASDFESFIVNLIYRGERPSNFSQMGASFIYGRTQRFLTLSRKFYSNTSHEYVGLSPEEWREKSMLIRREHEITHYYTKTFYGSASSNLHDELIADFMGMYSAFGHYDAKLFRHFMGLDGSDGRLSLYTSGLSPESQRAVAEIACECSEKLEAWQDTQAFRKMDTPSRIDYLCQLGIQGIIRDIPTH
ncbi:MAG: hypothetical protein IJS39_12685 [Synergistaceae bacterium]|nr:hypothetical protein [Synergistaceae bacterium]